MPNNYTLVVGAGVNKDINPAIDTGPELIRSIADRVTDRTSPSAPVLSTSLMAHFGQLTSEVRSAYLEHLDRYRTSVSNPFIDAFADEVETYPEFEKLRNNFGLITRAMIVAHVLGWEGSTTQENLKKELSARQTWLTVLGNFLERCKILELRKSATLNVNIVTFNYDRILEHYLLLRFGHDADFFIKNNISHVYGSIGALTEETKIYPDDHVVEMGFTNNDFTSIANWIYNIRLINQRTDPLKSVDWFGNAKKVIIFGYGLDPINNKRLQFEAFKQKDINFFFNIYVGNDLTLDFEPRRKLAEKVRAIKTDANLQYMSCADFLAYALRVPDI